MSGFDVGDRVVFVQATHDDYDYEDQREVEFVGWLGTVRRADAGGLILVEFDEVSADMEVNAAFLHQGGWYCVESSIQHAPEGE